MIDNCGPIHFRSRPLNGASLISHLPWQRTQANATHTLHPQQWLTGDHEEGKRRSKDYAHKVHGAPIHFCSILTDSLILAILFTDMTVWQRVTAAGGDNPLRPQFQPPLPSTCSTWFQQLQEGPLLHHVHSDFNNRGKDHLIHPLSWRFWHQEGPGII